MIRKGFLALCLVSSVFGAAFTPQRPYVNNITSEQVEKIAKWKPGDKGAPWQMSGQFEGDMVFRNQGRNGLKDKANLWPNGIIYYTLGMGIQYYHLEFFEEAFYQLEERTCLRFKPRDYQDEHLYITGGESGCWSEIGYQGGITYMNIQPDGCMYHGGIMHELLHALGFVHQHGAPNRDDYIEIQWENIESYAESNFQKYDESLINDYGIPYDYESIMHYDAYAYSKNGRKTILTKNDEEIGQRIALSESDALKINAMYNCP